MNKPFIPSVRSRTHSCLGIFITTVVTTTLLVTQTPSFAEEKTTTPVVGSFGVGGSMTADINERLGKLEMQVPLQELPAIFSGNGVNIGISYNQEAAENGVNRFGLGNGWAWSHSSYIDVDGGIRMSLPSGGMFEADASTPSGLARYTQEDVKFHQTSGVLEVHNESGPSSFIPYTYVLAHSKGKDYFNDAGDIVVQEGIFEDRTVFEWAPEGTHQLISVTNSAGSRIKLNWTQTGVTIESPARSDGVETRTLLTINGSQLVALCDPAGQDTTFGYNTEGLLDKTHAASGAVTEVSYAPLLTTSVPVTVVNRLDVRDSGTGEKLSTRNWEPIGEHNATGYPAYSHSNALWNSGDGAYRYYTQLSDEKTRIISEYNSRGLLLNQNMVASTSNGDTTLQEHTFAYPDTENGGVPNPGAVPPQYAQPTTTTLTFHDNLGRSRTTTEHNEFDGAGRLTKHTAPNGTVTLTTYDNTIPNGMEVPIGLVTEETTTGSDGTVTKTVNTPTFDHKTFAATETFTGTITDPLTSTSRTQITTETNGFVSEKRITATRGTTEGADKKPGTEPETVVTRFSSQIDSNAHTLTITQTDAADSPAQSTTSSTVDLVSGNPVATTDQTGRQIITTYDLAGRLLTSTDPAQRVTTMAYDDKNRITRVTNVSGVTTSEYVDALGRVTKKTDNIISTPDNTLVASPTVERVIETRSYENNSSRVIVTDELGRQTISVGDIFGRNVSVTGPNGVKKLTEYNDVDNTVTTGMVGASASELTDARALSTTQTDNSGNTHTTGARKDNIKVPDETTTYDGIGRPIAQTTLDVTTNVVFNPDGTPHTTTKTPATPDIFPGSPVTASREHNFLGISTLKTLSQAGETREGVSRAVDAAGRTVSETDQTGSTTTYEHTVDGLVSVLRNHATGVIIRNAYDATTRALTSTETTDPSGNITRTEYEYDHTTGDLLAVFDPANRDATQIVYTYDLLGNTTSTHYPDGKTITHSFTEHGQKTRTIDTVGNITTYEYDRNGALITAMQTTPTGDILARINYKYDEFGRTTKLIRGNGVTTTYTFNSTDQIKTETTTSPDNNTIFDAIYDYDTHGNLVKQIATQSRPGEITPETAAETAPAPAPTTTTTFYTYNAYNQLISSSTYQGSITGLVGDEKPNTCTAYEVGVTGNVTKETTTTPEAGTTVRAFEYNPLGQTTAITTNHTRNEQHYDAAGNLIDAADGTQHLYNHNNQPVTDKRPDETISYTYWATGKRRATTTVNAALSAPNTETVEFYWDDSTLINDTYTSSNTAETTASYLIGTARHTRTLNADPHTTAYFVADRHGNTAATTDATGAVTATYTYSDYGIPTVYASTTAVSLGAMRNPFQYAGEYTTSHATQPLGNRIYSPTLMAFTTKDTAELHNRYAYANANPITLVDPTGEAPNWDSLTNGLYSLMGIFMTVIGVGFSIPAGGAILGPAVVASFAAGFINTSLTTVQVLDEYVPNLTSNPKGIFNDTASQIVAGISLAVGVLTMTAGAVYSAFTRTKAAATAVASAKKIEALTALKTTAESELQASEQNVKQLLDQYKTGLRWQNQARERVTLRYATAVDEFMEDIHLHQSKRGPVLMDRVKTASATMTFEDREQYWRATDEVVWSQKLHSEAIGQRQTDLQAVAKATMELSTARQDARQAAKQAAKQAKLEPLGLGFIVTGGTGTLSTAGAILTYGASDSQW